LSPMSSSFLPLTLRRTGEAAMSRSGPVSSGQLARLS
jgi:hypothetical protein